jgi:oligoribonuclease
MNNVYFDKLLWIDTEYSSLDFKTALLLEIAVVVTDSSFNELASASFIVHNDEADLQLMKSVQLENPANKPEIFEVSNTYDLHENSGLLDLVRGSTNTLGEVENQMISFVDQHFPDTKPILAGNSIYFDRHIIEYRLPKLYSKLHYRMIDVTAFKLVLLNGGKPAYQKSGAHRALDDIRESIAELKYLLLLDKR